MKEIQLVWICIAALMVLALKNASSPAHVQPDADGLRPVVLLQTYDKSTLLIQLSAYGMKPV